MAANGGFLTRHDLANYHGHGATGDRLPPPTLRRQAQARLAGQQGEHHRAGRRRRADRLLGGAAMLAMFNGGALWRLGVHRPRRRVQACQHWRAIGALGNRRLNAYRRPFRRGDPGTGMAEQPPVMIQPQFNAVGAVGRLLDDADPVFAADGVELAIVARSSTRIPTA